MSGLRVINVGIREQDIRDTFKQIISVDRWLIVVDDATKMEIFETPVTPLIEEYIKVTALEYLSYLGVDFISIYEDVPYDILHLTSWLYSSYLEETFDKEIPEQVALDNYMSLLKETGDNLKNEGSLLEDIHKIEREISMIEF